MDIQETFLSVRGKQQINEITNPTTPNTILHVPCSVRVFIMTVNVRIWLPIIKIRKSSCAAPRTSRPKRPSMTSPASAMLWMCGYASLNWPRT